MIKNRISKYFRPTAEIESGAEQPRVKPSAFVAMPTPGSMPGQVLPNAMPPAMNIYEIALAEAQRKIAQSRANRDEAIDDLDDLSGWFDSSF